MFEIRKILLAVFLFLLFTVHGFADRNKLRQEFQGLARSKNFYEKILNLNSISVEEISKDEFEFLVGYLGDSSAFVRRQVARLIAKCGVAYIDVLSQMVDQKKEPKVQAELAFIFGHIPDKTKKIYLVGSCFEFGKLANEKIISALSRLKRSSFAEVQSQAKESLLGLQ